MANDWAIPIDNGVEEQEITFENDGIELSGTLFSPKDRKNGPALVVVQQAGTETRENPLYIQIAETFNAIGYSVLLYDRRGHGKSEGSSERPDYTTMAEDAVAGKHAIAKTEAVNSEQIGYWGISQGGWLGMEAAAMDNTGFVIVVSSPLTTPGEQMDTLAYNYVLEDNHSVSDAEMALESRRLVMHDYFRGYISHDSAKAVLREIENEPWFDLAFMPTADELPEDVEKSTWINEMIYDPLPAFEAIDAPMLFILGEEDIDIPVMRTLDIIEKVEDKPNREIAVIPGADHIMRVNGESNIDSDSNEDDYEIASNSTGYFMLMREWLRQLDF